MYACMLAVPSSDMHSCTTSMQICSTCRTCRLSSYMKCTLIPIVYDKIIIPDNRFIYAIIGH